jgi:hypothetical protein
MWIGSCPQAVWKFLPVALPGANLCLVGKLVGWSVYVIVVNCIPFYWIPRRLNSRLETAHFNGVQNSKRGFLSTHVDTVDPNQCCVGPYRSRSQCELLRQCQRTRVLRTNLEGCPLVTWQSMVSGSAGHSNGTRHTVSVRSKNITLYIYYSCIYDNIILSHHIYLQV